MHYHSSYAEITKTAVAHVLVINDRFRQIKALLTDPELLEMLNKESLVSDDGNPLSAEDVVSSLISVPVGRRVKIAIVERVA
jgi:hypothetical protein